MVVCLFEEMLCTFFSLSTRARKRCVVIIWVARAWGTC